MYLYNEEASPYRYTCGPNPKTPGHDRLLLGADCDKDGFLHSRNDEPACSVYNDPRDCALIGSEYYIEMGFYWCKHGFLYRENGPALIRLTIDTNRALLNEGWFLNKRHRIDGPSHTSVEIKKNILTRSELCWHIHGREIRKEQLETILNNHHMGKNWREWTESEKLIFRFATA